MRKISDGQSYLDFSLPSSLKIVEEFRQKYRGISKVLDANPQILDLVHRDLDSLCKDESGGGRRGSFTSENLFRCLLVHAIEGTPYRETAIRIAETEFLRWFVRLHPAS